MSKTKLSLKQILLEQNSYNADEVAKWAISEFNLKGAIKATPEGTPQSSSDKDAFESALNKIREALVVAYEEGYEDAMNDYSSE